MAWQITLSRPISPRTCKRRQIAHYDEGRYAAFVTSDECQIVGWVPMSRLPALAFVVKEFKEMLPPTIFFAVGFNLILLTTQLILDDYGAQFASFMLATAAALVVGKSVLVANALPFLNRYDTQPLIWPVIYKSAFYFVVVFVVRVLEKLIEYAAHGGTLAGMTDYVATHFTWHRFLAIQIWILVLFLIYTFITELDKLFGDGELYRILFRWRSSDLKLTRRQRIRTLTKLSRLTEAHTTDELRDPVTPAHAELVALLRTLAQRTSPRTPGTPVQSP